jgi:hypothetical protein
VIGGGCAPECGNGIEEPGEECDDGPTPGPGCCTHQCTFVAAGEICGDPCQVSTCFDGPPSMCSGAVPPLDGCTAASSTMRYLGGSGHMITPDGSVQVNFPADSSAPGTYAIAGGLATSQFGVGTDDTRVLVAQLLPDGATFTPPGVQVTFEWPDADSDGMVDGTTIDEGTLRLYHDGQPITATCATYEGTGCTAPCCSMVENLITVQVESFSEFVVVSEPGGVTTTTVIPSTTTTTLPVCTTVRCVLEQAASGPACGDETVPEKIAKKLARAVERVESAPGESEKKAAKLYKSAKRLMTKAAKAADKATRGKQPKLSAECATALQDAIAAATVVIGQ